MSDIEPRKREAWQDVALGAFLLGAVGLLIALFVILGGWRLGHGIHVTAEFTDATGLLADSPVVVAGVPIGRVEKLGVKRGKAVALLDLRRDSDVRADAIAVIRAKSLLGEKVVELQGGSPAAPRLADGARIERTQTLVEADQVLTRLAPVLEKLDPDDVARLIHAAAEALDERNIAVVVRAIDRFDRLVGEGAPKILATLDHVEKMAPKAGKLLGELELATPKLTRLIENADALAARGPALFDRTERFLARSDTLVGRTQRLVDGFDTTFPSTTLSVLRHSDVVLTRLPGSLDRLDRLADRVGTTLDEAQPTLDQLNRFLSDANIRRILREDGVRIHLVP
jgi:phospholipid/cholesterol/gamma-HCH transport system substrate-binding protein